MLRTLTKSTAFRSSLLRSIHTSSLARLRELYVEKKGEKTTVIGAKYVESPRIPYLVNLDKKDGKCPLCQLQLNLKHTDVLILSQYIDSKGNILRHDDTNLCKQQYKLVKELIYMAQHAGLLPEPPKETPKRPFELLNTYYDETTINIRPKYKKYESRFYYLKLGPLEKLRVKPELGFYFGKKYP